MHGAAFHKSEQAAPGTQFAWVGHGENWKGMAGWQFGGATTVTWRLLQLLTCYYGANAGTKAVCDIVCPLCWSRGAVLGESSCSFLLLYVYIDMPLYL